MADEIRYYIVECLLGLTTVKIFNALLIFLTLFLCVLSHPEFISLRYKSNKSRKYLS